MASFDESKISVSVRLNNGTDSEGNVATIGINLGRIRISTYDRDKVLAIKTVLSPCLSKSIYAMQETTVGLLSA